MNFGIRLRQLREEKGEGRRDLAARVRLSESYLERVERGQSAPPAALTICDLARALGADADELCALGGKVAPDLERLLVSSPLLVQLVRVASRLGAAEVAALLESQGAAPVEWCGGVSPKNDERRVCREAVTAEMKRAVFHLDGNECVYCSATTLLEVDHLQPVTLGGTNDLDNLVTSCAKCNKKKGNRAVPFVRVFGRFRLF